jgi:4,5-DOPA dioxygenase extradiol
MKTTPAVFISHGAPTTALETRDAFAQALLRFAGSQPRPRAIVVVSAHWQSTPLRVTASPNPKLIYDFGGFQDELYQVRYPSPGAPDLAHRIAKLVPGVELDGERGLDHGAWTPLKLLYPDADVPAVQLSLPRRARPADLLALGRALAPLRDEGVLLLGSGGAVHNLGRVSLADKDALPAAWALEFDNWLAGKLAAFDLEALENYRTAAPQASAAVPTTEHFDPLFVVLGAARPGERALPLFEGFQYGSLSMRSVVLTLP